VVRGDVEIVGLVDIAHEKARQVADEFGLREAVLGSDLEKVLKATHPDAVFDCTVPEAHKEVTLTALAHGCHVLGEKPLADTMANARCMVAAAAEAGRIYAVVQNRRYEPNIRALRRFIAENGIGRVTTVHSDFFIGAHFNGFRNHMKHVLLLDMAIHTFDAARFITGQDALTALAHEWNPPVSWYDYDASAVAVFEMTGGIVYTYRGSWCAEGLPTTWESSWRVIGERGTVLWDGGDQFRCEVVAGDTGFIRPVKAVEVPLGGFAGEPTGHAGVIAEFLNCIRNGGIPQTVAADNIKSLAMVHAAVASAERGCKVKVTELLEGS